MIEKSEFVIKSKHFFSKFVSEQVADSTINDMLEQKLGMFKKTQPLSEKIVEECVSTLFARVGLIKGDMAAEKFLHDIDRWRYGRESR